MKETYPIVFNDSTLHNLKNKMYIAVGNEEIEYIVGETIFDSKNIQEQKTWYRAARASVIQEFETVCDFLIAGEHKNAIELAASIKEYLIKSDSTVSESIKRFKSRIQNHFQE